MTTRRPYFRIYPLLFTLPILVLVAAPAMAADFHAPPRDFLFGNHIDTHQETELRTSGGVPVSLSGFLYIIYTGDVDPVSGLDVARHPRGAAENEECGVDVDCVAGWMLDGVPSDAKFLYHSGVNGNDHPVWMVNRADMVQPGSFTHFHWITATSNDPRAVNVSRECNKTNASDLEEKKPSAADEFCDGWFLELRAVRSFAFEHGGELVPVGVGLDNASHQNLVTNYERVPRITPTR